MVSKETFMSAVIKIRKAYNNNGFLMEDDALNVWYEAFKECNEWSFNQALTQTFKECYRLPVVADIYSRYNEIEKVRRQYVGYVVSEWGNMCGYYPGGSQYEKDWDAQVLFKKLTVDKFNGDYKQGYSLAKQIAERTKQYVDSHDKCIPFMDYLKKME